MSNPNNLTPHKAVTDALHRAILGLDSNSPSLFESACLTTPEMIFIGGGYSVAGWDAINALFARVFHLITMHVISNVRVTFPDADEDVSVATLTAHAVSYHVRPDDRECVEERSYTGYSLYNVELVKAGGDGGWKIKKWEIEVLRTTGNRTIVHG